SESEEDSAESSEEAEEEVKEEKVKEEVMDLDDPKAVCVDLDSDAESVKAELLSSGEDSGDDEESSGDVEELASAVWPTPGVGESLAALRISFVDQCLCALFRNRGPIWAKSKIDNFFQDIFYRRGCLEKDQQIQVEAWQARIKTLQKDGEHKVGDANNNPLEGARACIDSRETTTTYESDGAAWASKQTFDVREQAGGRNVLR
ncbi:unnamed protein product, partial [Polarella glacialis]